MHQERFGPSLKHGRRSSRDSRQAARSDVETRPSDTHATIARREKLARKCSALREKWRATQNSPSNLAARDQPLAKRNSAPAEASARRSLSMLREQLKPPNGGVFLGLNSLSSRARRLRRRGFRRRHQSRLKNGAPRTALQNQAAIASAVRPRGNRRTLWRGVTTRPEQP